MSRLKVLFVCSKNQWRSPTAEAVFKSDPRLDVRSRGTAKKAKMRVTKRDIERANVIFVMEKKHKDLLLQDHPVEARKQPVHVLEIPDDYEYMDPELVDILWEIAAPMIEMELES
ncbi:MAG: protein tyrosine phosphatase [Planctomycetota bacterium]